MTLFESYPDIPNVPGAYLLLLRLEKPVQLNITRWRGQELPPGLYVYAGSANGPGGLRARIGRHLKKEKRLHWHIDHVTGPAAEIHIQYEPGGQECALLANFQKRCDFEIPLKRFGASDCKNCASHFIRLSPDTPPNTSRRPSADWSLARTR
jgi:Uri superfamily endonuclease